LINTRLRVGLLLDSVILPAWAFAAIQRTICSSYVELALVVINLSSQQGVHEERTLRQERVPFLFHTFNTIDERLFLRNKNALTKIDAEELLSLAPRKEVTPIEENGENHLSAKDVAEIKAYHLDIVVKMGFARLGGDVLSAATYGIWAYRWGDPCKLEDGLTGFWEVVRSDPETVAALQQLRSHPDKDVILFESWFSTYPYSPVRNRNCVLWAAASFLPRQVERLHRLGGDGFFRELKNGLDENPDRLQTNGIPSNLKMLWIMIILAGRNLLEIYRRFFFRERWELCFSFDQDAEKNIPSCRKISPPKDAFWADPHIIYKQPFFFIFVEEYLYRTRRGHISVIEMDQNGKSKQPVNVLQENYHLSFPFVFEWMGSYYMIPESSEKKTIDLYECITFPNDWQRKITLMKDVVAVDSTIYFKDGKWWLFTAMAEQEPAAPQVELFLFYSDELLTDQWRPHPMNPIVSDVKKARAAGGIFTKNGGLFRPSQNCSKSYGYGFDINEIITLSETEYYERTVRSVRPDWARGIIGTHTYAYVQNLTVIDMVTRRFKWI
jgi:hypothetical protein